MELNLTDTKAALQDALNMVKRWEETAEKLADRLSQMKVCEHQWSQDVEILAEENGRDLSYYESQCLKCGINHSEHIETTF